MTGIGGVEKLKEIVLWYSGSVKCSEFLNRPTEAASQAVLSIALQTLFTLWFHL